MKGFPFTGAPVINEQGVITGFDRGTTAEEQRQFNLLLYTKGVDYTNPQAFQVVANGGMQVKVIGTLSSDQMAWAMLRGVFCLLDTTEFLVNITSAHATLDRIDRICIRVDDTQSQRKPSIQYYSGVPSSNPVAPEITETANIGELVIADIFVDNATTVISQSKITDRRLDPVLCGELDLKFKNVDFSPYYAQMQSLIQDLQEAIDNIIAGSETMLKTEYDPNGKGVNGQINVFDVDEYASGGFYLTGIGNNGMFVFPSVSVGGYSLLNSIRIRKTSSDNYTEYQVYDELGNTDLIIPDNYAVTEIPVVYFNIIGNIIIIKNIRNLSTNGGEITGDIKSTNTISNADIAHRNTVVATTEAQVTTYKNSTSVPVGSFIALIEE